MDKLKDGSVSLGLEGAHSKPRIVHAGGDATGKALVEYLIDTLPKNVVIHEHEFAFELLMNTNNECIGVKTKSQTEVNTYLASYVIVATGGAGALYSITSNPLNSFGDGIALSYLAGAKIADMEFIQFHPSLLFVNGEARGLISEAVRGAGGYFINEIGERIMEGVHPLKDLAPRHITAYEIYKERMKGHEVYIDISDIHHFEEKFPTITSLCKENGIDLSKKRIPVAPGSHFLMGGIISDVYGRTSIPRLLAVGEVACTGVHGANRLASNSLLEGMTFGKLMAENLLNYGTQQYNLEILSRMYKANVEFHLLDMKVLQKEMLEKVGILRDSENLQSLLSKLPTFEQISIVDFSQLNRETIEQFFMHITASLTAKAALVRTESRGSHIRSDFPTTDEDWEKKWIIFEHGKLFVRDELYEHNQTSIDVKTVL